MKRLFTLAIIAMVASFTFAQAPYAKKATKKTELVSLNAMEKKMKEAKEMKAVQVAKAAAAQETSTSVFRRSAKNVVNGQSIKNAKVLQGVSLNTKRTEAATMAFRAPAQRVVTQEGNVTITTANGIITDVTGVEAKYYQRSNDGIAYFVSNGSMYYDYQSGIATIIEDGDNVYMKDPISKYAQNSWVKGTKNGNTITVPTKQPLLYSANYNTTISLRWGVITAGGEVNVADAYADAFTFTIDGDVITLEGTAAWTGNSDAYYIGAFWDDDDSETGYGDAETILTLDNNYVAPSTELVEVPEGAEIAQWYMNGINEDKKAIRNQEINVAFANGGSDIYVQGICGDFPESWIKGTLDGETSKVTFPTLQFVGTYSTYNIWCFGYDTSLGDACDMTATYDQETNTITFDENVRIVENAASDHLYYLAYYDNVVLSIDEQEFVEPTITDLTAELPYFNGFDTDEEQAEAAIYDANEDGRTFTFSTDDSTESIVARYTYSSTNDGDDYVVFPGLELKAGTFYKVSIDARSYSASWPERVEVVAGAEAKASQLNISVIEPTDVAWGEYVTLKNENFQVEEDGTYYLAVHGISNADMFYLYVDNFSVVELNLNAPAAISDFTVEADATGANKVNGKFTVPSSTLDGSAINENVTVTVTRGEEKVYMGNVKAGDEITFEDEVEEPGMYVYTAVAETSAGESEKVSVKLYVGEDTPNSVENLTAADNDNGTVGLTWEAPTTGINNGVIIPENLKYNVYPVEMEEFWGWLFPSTDYENPYETGLTETNTTVSFDTNVGEQGYSYFAVTAENEQGESDDVYGTLLTGAPYTLPMFESCAGDELAFGWYGTMDDNNYDNGGTIRVGSASADDDGASFEIVTVQEGWGNLQTGKVALSGRGALSFHYMSNAAAKISVIVAAPGKEDVVVEVVEATAADEFAKVDVSLAEFVGETWVRVSFFVETEDAATVNIDNISIIGFDNDIVAKAISAPNKVEANKEFNVTVKIANEGANVAEGYTVELYKNGEKVAENAGETIASANTVIVAFPQTLSVLEAEAEYSAAVVYDVDENETNNETVIVSVEVKKPNYPAVEDLAGEVTTEGVELTWSEPNMENAAPDAVTETFEDAEPFGLTVDGWTMVDQDGGEMGGIQGVDLGVESGAWFVFDNTELGEENFVSHSGNKFMSTMYNNDGSKNNDWMISPTLYGGAQTISFWATSFTDSYGLEQMEVLYSTTDKEIDSFESLGTVEVPAEWTEYSYDLPEGAKYFAIRYVSQDVFMLWVDDVTFIPANVAADLALVGYNVYRDGLKVTAEPVAETTYVDATAEKGSHTYVVTVVYEQGESAPSNEVVVDTATAISSVNAENGKVKVYTIDGRQVSNTALKGVYIIESNGKTRKVTVK